MLHIIYRYWAGESSKPSLVRPPWFSKARCLRSLLNERMRTPETHLTFLVDGSIPDQISSLLEFHAGAAGVEVVQLVGHGNVDSCAEAYLRGTRILTDDIVYFVEDDYLHRPGALRCLVDLLEQEAIAYATLYDHPDRYTRFDDYPLISDRVFVAGHWHWRPVECTTMTFAARVHTLRKDRGIFTKHVRPGEMYPQDRAFWRDVQDIPPKDGTQRRLLYAPIPSLATHCEVPYLAPCVDWQDVANEVVR